MNKEEDFIKRASSIHQYSYDYSKVKYINSKTPVEVICKEHGSFFPTPNNHTKTKRPTSCPVCAKSRMTGAPPIPQEEIIRRFKEIHGDTYDYSQTVYTNMFEKVRIRCKIHGYFDQLPTNHLSNRGCKKCGWINRKDSRTLTTEEFINRATETHRSQYNYDKVDYKSAREVVTITCKRHGDFSQTAFDHLKGSGCPKCATIVSKPHKLVLSWLEGEKVVVNDRKLLSGKELDIYLPEHKLGIEIHGLYWHSSKFVAKTYHREKLEAARAAGMTLLQFWDAEVLNKSDLVKSMILSRIGKSGRRVFARKCKIRDLTQIEYCNFLEDNHIQGKINSKIRKGLYYDEELVSVMGVTKRGKETHLDRFCVVTNTSVVGGFNKLLASLKPQELVSFSDNRYSEGNVYEKTGFVLDKENKFTLHYTDNLSILPRHRFMRHKLEEEFGQEFSETLTSEEICASQGIYQLWGPGTKKWVYSKS